MVVCGHHIRQREGCVNVISDCRARSFNTHTDSYRLQFVCVCVRAAMHTLLHIQNYMVRCGRDI